tara:strand:+ start:155 stop:436 length:282 start_codon:yes stop_codon:yes gene_type:complete
MQHILTAHSFSIRAIETIFEAFRSLSAHRKHASLVRETIKELNKLSTKDLNDIGLCRGDIYSIANRDVGHLSDRINFSDEFIEEVNPNLRGSV